MAASSPTVRSVLGRPPAAAVKINVKKKPLIGEEIVQSALPKLLSLRFYSNGSYREMNKDVVDRIKRPAHHALQRGAIKGLKIFRSEEVARALAQVGTPHSDLPLRDPQLDVKVHGPALAELDVYVSSLGNVFMQEIAADLARDFEDCGVRVRLRNENTAVDLDGPPSLVVAPHEFFLLGHGFGWITPEFLARTYVYNTEQVQTPWFARTLPFVLSARGIIDLCPQLPPLLREAGVEAMHLEPRIRKAESWLKPGDENHPLLATIPNSIHGLPAPTTEWDQRPIDVAFFGNSSVRRDSALASYAGRLAKYSNFIYYVRRSSPITDGVATRLAGYVATQSKIYLNIHRDEFPYFEWHRIARQGMACGSVVVTDQCLPHPVFKPGVHFLQTEARHIPNLIEWLLEDPEGQAKARNVVEAANAVIAAQDTNHDAMAALEFMATRPRGGINASV